MNNSFEIHTENLKRNLESVQRYMERFKDSIKGDLPFKDLISEALKKIESEEQINESHSNKKESEITIEMKTSPFFIAELEDELSKTTELIKLSSENAYAETRIHIYSLFTHIITIFEDYLKKF